VLAASQSPVSKAWFQGTADAVRQYMWLFDETVRDGIEDFLILAGARPARAGARARAGPPGCTRAGGAREPGSRPCYSVALRRPLGAGSQGESHGQVERAGERGLTAPGRVLRAAARHRMRSRAVLRLVAL